MKFSLISIKKKILDTEKIESVSVPTKDGTITILPNHEPLISALKPGILRVKLVEGGKERMFAIGGGVLDTDGESLNIIVDMVEDGMGLDIDKIKIKKEEAKELMKKYRDSKEVMDMEKYVELEYEYLKESAKEQLVSGC